ncbi:hypothetical protein F8S13_20560 [Chloroflexia bacterium SDU3-3]|nr:hypothetical protein F8S13_20560 [Chloroflexia bacterium SDU3-3]
MVRLFILFAFAAATLVGCSPIVQNVSQGTPKPLPDGTVLLLRQGTTYGAIVLDRQQEIPEQVSFTWYYRNDGGSILDPNDPKVTTGQALSRGPSIPEMRFGTFVVPWSIAATGLGYVYYDRLTSAPAQPNQLEIAITDLSAVVAVDAANAQWHYRSAPPAYYTYGGNWYFD